MSSKWKIHYFTFSAKFAAKLLGGVVVVLSISALFFYQTLSRDKAEIEVAGQFKAKRNAVGIWKIQAESPKQLAFAFGCVQAHDRLFQTELMRRFGTGRLSEWFGDMTLSRDRLMRFGAEVAKWEWQEWEKKPELAEAKIMLESYIEGRRACINSAPVPFEFRLLKINAASAADWQAWEILAITRAHAADFSYDHRDEVGRFALEKFFGAEYAKMLTPSEPTDSAALYDQIDSKDLQQPANGTKETTIRSLPFFPTIATAAAKPQLPIGELQMPMGAIAYSGYDLVTLGAETGASNAWVSAKQNNNGRASLCNDTHLGFLWPSTLYPIEYELTQKNRKVIGSGFALPGIPALNIGRVAIDENGKRQSVLEWGITIANYVDVQNLVQLDGKIGKKEVGQLQKFRIVDPKSHDSREESFQETWTEFGPRVDAIIDWMGAPQPKQAIAFQWAAFRKEMSAVPFFINRTLNGAVSLQDDFKLWTYPSVNFNWLEWKKNEGTWAGHTMTGTVFKEDSVQGRIEHRTFLTEMQARILKTSEQIDRPYIFKRIENDTDFFFTSGNHRIYAGELGLKLAFHWNEGSRAKRLVEMKKKITDDVPSGQFDLVSKQLSEFQSWIFKNLRAQDICESADKTCAEIFTGLEQFTGEVLRDSWQVTVLTLWERELKLSLWKKSPRDIAPGPERQSWLELHRWWDRSGLSRTALFAILKSPEQQKKLNDLLGKSIKELFKSSWATTLQSLQASGEEPNHSYRHGDNHWRWENYHQIAWQHPLLRIPGVAGKILRQHVFPEGPKVAGNGDSPAVMQFLWSASEPLNFSAVHGPVMRTCMAIEQDGSSSVQIANITGVSGNPFSKYSHDLSDEYFFRNRHFSLER